MLLKLKLNQKSLQLYQFFRMLNSESGDHFFSADQNEINYIQENLPEFIFEDVAFQVLEF